MIKKYIITGLLICIGFIVSAQVMLPAYQGVFSKKIMATDLASNGLDFDGVNDYSLTNLNLDVSVVPITTWEAWVYPTANDGNYRMIMGIEDTGWDRFVAINSGNFIVGYGCGGWSPVSIDLNKWQHIAVVFNEASNVLLFYKNGVEYTISTAGCSHSSNVKFAIGCSQQGALGQFYQGAMDDVRIWNVARTQAEIQGNMNSELLGTETGLVAYYPFNQGIAAGDNSAISTVINKSAKALNGSLSNFAKTGATSNFVNGKVKTSTVEDGLILNLDANNINSYSGSGSTWNDVSGNNRNGTLPAGVTSTIESEIKYFNFSSSSIAINLPKTQSMTYFVWAKSSIAACASPYMVLFGTGTAAAPADPQLFFRACFHYWNTQDGPGNRFGSADYSSHGTNWHNYAVVNDAVSNTAKLYYDGIFVGAAVYKNSKIDNFIIGNSVNLNSPWQGGIANVRAYNKSLTNSEILNVYISTKGIFGY
jgi:hypothetical protein